MSTPPATVSTDNLKAIVLMSAAMVLFAIDDAAVKAAGTWSAGAAATPGEIIIIKGAVSAMVYGLLAWREGTRFTLRLAGAMLTNKPIALRTLGDLIAVAAIITALTLMPLSNLSAILQALPLMVTLGAALILKERVGWRRWSAILVGFVGVMIIIRPTTQGWDSATLWALLGALGLAIRDLSTRAIDTQFSTFSIVTMVAALLIPLGFLMHAVMHSEPIFVGIAPRAWLLTFVSAVFGMAGYYAITQSMRIGELSAVAPYRYTRLVAALILAFLFFDEVPDLPMLIGSVLVIGAGLFSLYRERKLKIT